MSTPRDGSYAVTLRHSFEASHRLPHLPGKCRNVHGHSWLVEVTVEAPDLSDQETLVEFGQMKAAMRGWVDGSLDHAFLIGGDDPLLPAVVAQGCAVFVFGGDPGTDGFAWPTVEAVAAVIGRQAPMWLAYTAGEATTAPAARIGVVRVRETANNVAEWRPR